MGLNKGERINFEELGTRATLSNVLFRGACGQRMYLSIDDWKKLKRKVGRQIREAKKRAMNNPINKEMAKVPPSVLVFAPKF